MSGIPLYPHLAPVPPGGHRSDANEGHTMDRPRPDTGQAAMMDRFWRVAYRVGFRAARLWWRLRRPDHDGAVVAVWLGGRILAVQQSYRTNPSWPGGGIRRGEQPREAARRELREELGLEVGPEDLVFAREMVVDWDFRRDHVRVFELCLRAEPVLRIDNREIVAARFVEPQALLAEAVLPPFIGAYLGERRSDHQRPPTGA
jgi:8-oxo-dGTP diphosphatase